MVEMAAPLEEILGNLLLPDNSLIQQATQQLKDFFKDPASVSGLCQVLGSSQNPQIRQYAAVLLRRKVHKQRQWKHLSDDIRTNIRDNILQLLWQEPEKSVRNAIAQIAATVAKHDLPEGKWQQFEIILRQIRSEDPVQREMGMMVLHTITMATAEQMKTQLTSLLALISDTLCDQQSKQVQYYAVRMLTELVFFIGDDELKLIQSLLPKIMEVIKFLIQQDEEQACEAMEIFDEMLESEVSIIVPHIKSVVEFCLEVAASSNLGDSIRVKAMSFIASLLRLKKKAVVKHRLVVPILDVLFPILCADEEEDTEDEDDVASHTPAKYCVQVIDTMALHLPPEKLIPNLMALVEPALTNEKPGPRRAAYIAMAVVSEGCADYITNNHLNALLQCVGQGLNDPNHLVQNAALFAVGQFSENLQPDISKYAPDILPLLFQHLSQASQQMEKNPAGVTKSYYALEMFCENLGKDILPYLPTLMEHLLTVLQSSPTFRPKELAISAIGATANAAKEGMQPYFQQILELFKSYLTSNENEDMRKLQIQTIDTLGVLARTVGAETFAPLANECVQLGINLLDSCDDPDLRRCIYGLFAALSCLLKADMAQYMANIVNQMTETIKSTEGVKTHFKDDSDQVVIFDESEFDDDEELTGDEEDEDLDDIAGISVENAYLEEKEDTCCALGELAVNTGSIFMPYLETSFKEVLQMSTYPAASVKKAAIVALGQFCCTVHEVNKDTPTPETETALNTMLLTVVPQTLEVIKADPDREVVMAAVDTINEMLNKIGRPLLLITGTTDVILTRMKEIFTHKTECQDQSETDDDEDQQAELDGMLIESAGDVLPVMAKLMNSQAFLPFFSSFLTDLMKRLKESSAVSERSFAVGTLGEIIDSCPAAAANFSPTLYPLFMKFVHDEDYEVRSNSIFSLGILASNGGEAVHVHYPDILKCLFDIMTKESMPRALDNICAAVCRMMWTNINLVPVDQVLPVVMQCLPLKEDFEENITVYNCLTQLYNSGNQQILQYVPQLVKVIGLILGTDQIKEDTQAMVVQFIKNVRQNHPQQLQAAQSDMPPESVTKIEACLLMANGIS